MELLAGLLTKECAVLTVNVVLDLLDDYELLHAPSNTLRKLSWCTVPEELDVDDSLCSQNGLLVLMHTHNAATGLTAAPKAIGLLVLRSDEPFSIDEPPIMPSHLERVIVVREQQHARPFTVLFARLQRLFFEMHCWADRCVHLVKDGGSLQDLIDASMPVFGNWIVISDSSYSLLAHSKGIEPPDELSRTIVENGCHTSEQIEIAKAEGVLREWREQQGVKVFAAYDRVPFDHLTRVLRVDEVYGGHVVMVCTKRQPSAGLVDLFNSFCDWALSIIERDNSKNRHCFVAYQDFLLKLVEGVDLNPGYVANQKEIIGISGTQFFCLASVDAAGGAYEKQNGFLLSVVNETFPLALAMNYDGSLLILFYAADFEEANPVDQHELIEKFCARYECVGFLSSAFKTIEHVHYAYEQTKIVRRYRSAIEESRPHHANEQPMRVFRFADAFSYYCCDFTASHDPFILFCLNNTPLDVIAQFEQARDVSDLKLLYCYLYNERRATQTARQLFMHRNNVLYRVKSIEHRFQLNLDDFNVRQALLTCFRARINSSMSFRKLLE